MKPIYDSNGKQRGFMLESSNRISLFNPFGKQLGYYEKSMDKTFSPTGKFIGYGNQLFILLN